MTTPKSWTDRAKVHLEEERSLPMTRPFGELPAKTEPQTAAGREFARRIAHFQIIGDIGSILEIEAEAAAPVAQPASLDMEQVEAAFRRMSLRYGDEHAARWIAVAGDGWNAYRVMAETFADAYRKARLAAAAPVAQPAPLDLLIRDLDESIEGLKALRDELIEYRLAAADSQPAASEEER